MKKGFSSAVAEACATAGFFLVASVFTVLAARLDLSVVPGISAALLGAVLTALIWRSALTAAVALAGPHGAGHCNPGVTLSLGITGQVTWIQVLLFVLAQFTGAALGLMLGAAALAYNPLSEAFHAMLVVRPAQDIALFTPFFWLVFALEGAFLFALALGVSLYTAEVGNERREWAVVAGRIGGILGFGVLAIGSVTGGSINPVRFLVPYLLSGTSSGLGVALVAYAGSTVIAGLLAGLVAKVILSSQT